MLNKSEVGPPTGIAVYKKRDNPQWSELGNFMGVAGASVAAANTDDHAVLVGIGRYERFDSLKGPLNDVALFKSWLESPVGGSMPARNIHEFVSPTTGPYLPLRDDIENCIVSEFFDRSDQVGGRIGRRLYLYFAGHGVAPADGEECALVMANSPAAPTLRGFMGRHSAQRIFRQPMFEEVVLVMDCCRTIGLVNAGENAFRPPTQPLPNAKEFHALASKWDARAAERELPKLDVLNGPTGQTEWQGVFTHALVDCLMHAGDPNAQGDVTSVSLEQHLYRAIENLLPGEASRSPLIDFTRGPANPPIRFAKGRTPKITLAPGAGIAPTGVTVLIGGQRTNTVAAVKQNNGLWTAQIPFGVHVIEVREATGPRHVTIDIYSGAQRVEF